MTTLQAVRDSIAGPVVGLPTLFTADYRINHAGMREHVQFLVERGIRVLMLSVGISEYQHLSEAEIKAVTQTVSEAAAGRALVIAETWEWWTGQAVEFARFAEDVGAGAVLVVPPHTTYQPYTPAIHDDDLYRHYETIAAATKLPILFHLRALRGRGTAHIWSMSLIERVAAIDSVIGLKDESTSLLMAYDLLRTLPREIVLIDDGGPSSFFHTFAAGAPAWITGTGQFAPHLDLEFYDHLKAGRLHEAHRHAIELHPRYFSLFAKYNWVAVIKAGMDMVGLPGGPMRPPTPNLTPAQVDDIRSLLASIEIIKN